VSRLNFLVFGLLPLVGCGGADGSDGSDATAPGTSGVNTGISCAESDLIAQCPLGSSPDLSAEATSACNGQVDFLLSGDGGGVHATCKGKSECLVVCQFASPCLCGVVSVTREAIVCVDCATASACGNARCEGGEDQNTCPVDCAAVCPQGTRRCNGRDREDCNAQGSWETVTCRPDQACEVGAGGVACQANLNPSGGTFPGTGFSDARLPYDPADIYFAEAELSVNLQTGNGCLPLAFIDESHVLCETGNIMAIYGTDGAPPEALPINAAPLFTAADLPWILTPTRQPEIFNLETRQKRTAEAVVDDVTDLKWGPAAVDAQHKRGAVAFAAAGEPFIALYDLESGRIETMLRYAQTGQTTPATGLDFSPDGQLLAEVRDQGLCIVWNVAERKHTRLINLEWDPNGFPIHGQHVAFTRGEGPYLLISHASGVELWDLEENARLRVAGGLQGRSNLSGHFSLSPDGRIVSAYGPDSGFGLYYLNTFEHIRSLNALPINISVPGSGPQSTMYGLFSPDGRRFALGSVIYASYEE
jgi:hypothetical protein